MNVYFEQTLWKYFVVSKKSVKNNEEVICNEKTRKQCIDYYRNLKKKYDPFSLNPSKRFKNYKCQVDELATIV